MMRSAVLRMGLAATLLALPVAAYVGYSGLTGARAQSFPPSPPMVLYGSAEASTLGQAVHAFVQQANGNWTWCGQGAVVSDNDGQGYVVQVAADSQISGCGVSGRIIGLYFTSVVIGGTYDGTAGRISEQTATWASDPSVPKQHDVTLGDSLEVQGVVAGIAARVQ